MAWGRPGVLALELCKPGMAHSCNQEVEAGGSEVQKTECKASVHIGWIKRMRGCREGGHRRFKSYILIEEYFSHSVNTVCYAHLWG